MEKLPEYVAEEDIKDWIEIYECRADCSKIKDDKKRLQWCWSVIGSEGRRILKNLPDGTPWRQVKGELRK